MNAEASGLFQSAAGFPPAVEDVIKFAIGRLEVGGQTLHFPVAVAHRFLAAASTAFRGLLSLARQIFLAASIRFGQGSNSLG
jgi:hypothetical protein